MKKILVALCALIIPVIPSVSPVQAAKLPCAKYHRLMRQNGLPVRTFSWIMARESSCKKRVVNWNYYPGKDHTDCKSGKFARHRRCKAVKSFDLGLLQLNYQTWDKLTVQICGSKKSTILLKPSCNLAVAGEIYRRYGTAPWEGNSNE